MDRRLALVSMLVTPQVLLRLKPQDSRYPKGPQWVEYDLAGFAGVRLHYKDEILEIPAEELWNALRAEAAVPSDLP